MPERFEIIRSIKALYKSPFLSFPISEEKEEQERRKKNVARYIVTVGAIYCYGGLRYGLRSSENDSVKLHMPSSYSAALTTETKQRKTIIPKHFCYGFVSALRICETKR